MNDHYFTKMSCGATLLLAMTTLMAHGQSPVFQKPSHSADKVEAVQYLFPEQVTLPADKPSPLALHFRIAQGLHINSHAPKDEFLIPTVFSVPESSGVRLEAADYPPGINIVLPVDPNQKLNVYTGEFTIQARVTAKPGDHMVEAKLRYQACDENACLPPKTITVPIDVVGK
jgi:cytochrome c biogenesis DsbD-like protein